MIKKLNKDRGEFKRKPWLYYFDEGTDDSSRISYDAHSIDMTLRDLHERLWFHSLRLRHALTYQNSQQKKAELKFQQRIVDEHLKKIKELQKENDELQWKNLESRIAEEGLKIVR
jgi:hypothetical protein